MNWWKKGKEVKKTDYDLVHLFSIINNLSANDPVHSCQLYLTKGCAHVDGPLCDYPNCKPLEKYLAKINNKHSHIK